MLYSALAFLAGVAGFQTLAHMPSGSAGWLAAALPLAFSGRWPLRAAGIAAAGFLWAWWCALQLLQVRLPEPLERKDIVVEGTVSGLPEPRGQGTLRFRFNIDRYGDAQGWRRLDLPVRLNWYRQAPQLHPGERWRLRVRLKQPRGFTNPGTFDYERWLFSRAIRATGYVRRDAANRRVAAAPALLVDGWREALAGRVAEALGDSRCAGLLTALAVGLRTGISPRQWETLRRTGTSHLMAISGLHVGLVAGLVFLAVRKAWSRWAMLRHWPAPRVAAAAAMMAALGYALLAGFEVPAQRALIMVCVWMLARYWWGMPGPWRVWSIALWVVLLLDPLSVLGAGFWLSFAAVGWIFYLTSGRFGHTSRWRRACYVQLGLVAGLTPLLWLWFHQVSLIAPLANLVAVPWVSLLVVPLLLLGAAVIAVLPAPGELLLLAAGLLLEALWYLLEWLAALPATVLTLPGLPPLLLAVLGLGLAGALAARPLPLRMAGLLLIAAAICFRPARPAPGDLWLTLLDVGQGLSVVVETSNHVLVYDAGPAFRGGFDAGESVVAPYLVHRGYRHIDRLVISHSDNDHSGGGESLFTRLDVRRIDSGEPQNLHWARSRACRGAQQWRWDRVAFAYLAPLRAAAGNNASCVLRIETADGQVVLLPGDIERGVERQLVATLGPRLAADVLVVPHHGSRTSSTPGFVSAVQPRVALFATGYRNRFGFPKPQVRRRYAETGAKLFNSAHSGAIGIRLRGGKPAEIVEHRARSRHYWR